MAASETFELLDAISPAIQTLMDEHNERREHWYAHELVPWELGRNFKTEPWDESECTIAPEARTSLLLNLLTEDNLPYYHSEIELHSKDHELLAKWNRQWTAEEGQHAIALRSYLLTSRNADPRELEDDRLATMTTGYRTGLPNPIAIFAYTSAQELATRVSHRNAGKLTDDPVAYEIMSRIAVDENHHFMFYRGAVTAMLRENPSLVLPEIYRVLSNFEMPGVGMPKYMRRALTMAKAGVYNMRIHHDRVLVPLLRDWKIDSLTGLNVAAQQMQEKILAVPALANLQAEKFERRYGLA